MIPALRERVRGRKTSSEFFSTSLSFKKACLKTTKRVYKKIHTMLTQKIGLVIGGN